MDEQARVLLVCDSVINLILGVCLLLFPAGVVDLLGLPPTATYFYPAILGGVIFGIGIALGIERLFFPSVTGLGLGGAIAINLCGGSVLLYWLLFSPPDIPLRGTLILWIVAVAVVGIGIVELITGAWRHGP